MQEVVREYAPRATFVTEDFGTSPLGKRFGIDEYPAVFVDDVLIARPEDFFGWGGAVIGKYKPWSDPVNRTRFQADVRRAIEMRLRQGAGQGPSSFS